MKRSLGKTVNLWPQSPPLYVYGYGAVLSIHGTFVNSYTKYRLPQNCNKSQLLIKNYKCPLQVECDKNIIATYNLKK